MRQRPGPAAKRRVLFVCTGNACRSPMAEGLLRLLAGDRYESLSAGSHPAGFVHEHAVRALAEIGADISGHRSRSWSDFVPPRGDAPDVVVTLCDFALSQCRHRIPATIHLHWPVFDPILAEGTVAERLDVFRRVRGEIRERIEDALRRGLFEG